MSKFLNAFIAIGLGFGLSNCGGSDSKKSTSSQRTSSDNGSGSNTVGSNAQGSVLSEALLAGTWKSPCTQLPANRIKAIEQEVGTKLSGNVYEVSQTKYSKGSGAYSSALYEDKQCTTARQLAGKPMGKDTSFTYSISSIDGTADASLISSKSSEGSLSSVAKIGSDGKLYTVVIESSSASNINEGLGYLRKYEVSGAGLQKQ